MSDVSVVEIGPLFPTWDDAEVKRLVALEVAHFTEEYGRAPDEVWFCDSSGQRICRWPEIPPALPSQEIASKGEGP